MRDKLRIPSCRKARSGADAVKLKPATTPPSLKTPATSRKTKSRSSKAFSLQKITHLSIRKFPASFATLNPFHKFQKSSMSSIRATCGNGNKDSLPSTSSTTILCTYQGTLGLMPYLGYDSTLSTSPRLHHDIRAGWPASKAYCGTLFCAYLLFKVASIICAARF